MSFTNQVLQDEVHAALATRDDLTVAAGSRIERWLNIAQVKITRELRWEELEVADAEETLPADATSLAYPASFRYQQSLVLKDGDSTIKLAWLHPEVFDSRFPKIHDATATLTKSSPVFFTNWAKSWAFWPVPDVEYKINLKKGSWPTALATLGQTTDLEEKDDLLINLATADLMNSLGMADKAVKQFNIYSALLATAKDEEKDKPGRDIVPDFETGIAVGDYWLDPFVRSVI